MRDGTEASEAGAASAAVETTPHEVEAVPLAALDRALSPLRRTAAFGLRESPDAVRFLEVIGGRWLRDALRLDLPSPIRDGLAAIGGRLGGFDAAPREDRRERLRQIHQHLARIDAVLGLPLRFVPERSSASGDEKAPRRQAPAKERSGRKGRGKSSRGRDPQPAPEQEAETATTPAEAPSARGHRLGDPELTGQSLRALGCPPALADALEAHQIVTLVDLLWTPPCAEEVLRPLHGAGRPIPAGRAAVGGRVVRRCTKVGPRGERRLHLIVQGAGRLEVICADPTPSWLAGRLAPGTRVVFAGDYEPGVAEGDEGEVGGVLRDAEWVFADGHHAAHLARYGLDGVRDSDVRAEINRLVPLLEGLRDPLSTARAGSLALPALADALRLAHQTVSANPEARRRLAFDECVTAFLGLAARGDARRRGIAHPVVHGLIARASRIREFALTDPEQAAFESIKRDLRGSAPMTRLLAGEVSSGPESVAMSAAVLVAESKSQVLWVANDRATAESRLLFAEPYLREVGLVARLLDESPSKAQRDALRRGEVHIAFGTPAALGAELEPRRLGLVIVDEDTAPRRGWSHVRALRAPQPDLLVVATAPPPTMAYLRAYADHAITEVRGVLTEGARPEVLEASERMVAYQRAAARVKAGEQAWVVFPMVRGHDALDAREVARLRATLGEQVFPGARIGVFHGAMTREDRLRTYEDFVHRRIDVLVATTVFEEGPRVPGATVALVEQADKLDARRAVRIRGHLARCGDSATASFILGDAADPGAAERLRRALDGDAYNPAPFDEGDDVVWPEDGPPIPTLRWARLDRDRALVLAAHALVTSLIDGDPALRSGPGSELAIGGRALWTRVFDGPDPLPEPRPEPSGGRRRRRRRKRK